MFVCKPHRKKTTPKTRGLFNKFYLSQLRVLGSNPLFLIKYLNANNFFYPLPYSKRSYFFNKNAFTDKVKARFSQFYYFYDSMQKKTS